MESQRSILIIGLLLVRFLLCTNYQETYGPKPCETVPTDQSQQQNTPAESRGGDLDATLSRTNEAKCDV